MKRWMIALTLFLLPGALSAQQDRTGTYLDWGTVGVAIYPDTEFGLQLRMAARRFDIGSLSHDAGGGYEPDSIYAWVNAAAQVLHPASRPSSPDAVLMTPVLRSTCGDSLRLLRRAKGNKWGSDLVLSFDVVRPRGDHFGVQAKGPEVSALLDALIHQASLSAIRPDTAATADREPPPDTWPSVRELGREFGLRLHGGIVVVQYRVDSTGHAEMGTLHPVFSSSDDLTDATRMLLRKTLFFPATRNGHPVAATIRQTVNFGP